MKKIAIALILALASTVALAQHNRQSNPTFPAARASSGTQVQHSHQARIYAPPVHNHYRGGYYNGYRGGYRGYYNGYNWIAPAIIGGLVVYGATQYVEPRITVETNESDVLDENNRVIGKMKNLYDPDCRCTRRVFVAN